MTRYLFATVATVAAVALTFGLTSTADAGYHYSYHWSSHHYSHHHSSYHWHRG